MSKINQLFSLKLIVINMGLKSFSGDLEKQDVHTVHINWKPPAGGNKKMVSLLSKLKSIN